MGRVKDIKKANSPVLNSILHTRLGANKFIEVGGILMRLSGVDIDLGAQGHGDDSEGQDDSDVE